jgi:hypothetical protein
MHHPDGDIAPSTTLHDAGGWKFAQFAQLCLPFGVGLYDIALGDIFAAAAGEATRPALTIAPPPAAAANRKSRRDTRVSEGACSCAISRLQSVVSWTYVAFNRWMVHSRRQSCA